MCHGSVCVHVKAKTRSQQTSNGRKKMQRVYEKGIKQISVMGMASKEARKQANKRKDKQKKGKQKVVSAGDKCRFGSDVHSFIMLKHG